MFHILYIYNAKIQKNNESTKDYSYFLTLFDIYIENKRLLWIRILEN